MAMERQGEKVIYCRRGDVIDIDTWELLKSNEECKEPASRQGEKEVKKENEDGGNND